MPFRYVCLLLISVCLSAAARTAEPDYRKLSGTFMVYGGGLGDTVPATKNDAKVSFFIDGQAAVQMFNAMGPDVQDPCTQGSGTRVRKKKNEPMICTRSAQGAHACSFGFDLKSGKSIGGSIC